MAGQFVMDSRPLTSRMMPFLSMMSMTAFMVSAILAPALENPSLQYNRIRIEWVLFLVINIVLVQALVVTTKACTFLMVLKILLCRAYLGRLKARVISFICSSLIPSGSKPIAREFM